MGECLSSRPAGSPMVGPQYRGGICRCRMPSVGRPLLGNIAFQCRGTPAGRAQAMQPIGHAPGGRAGGSMFCNRRMALRPPRPQQRSPRRQLGRHSVRRSAKAIMCYGVVMILARSSHRSAHRAVACEQRLPRRICWRQPVTGERPTSLAATGRQSRAAFENIIPVLAKYCAPSRCARTRMRLTSSASRRKPRVDKWSIQYSDGCRLTW